ncbi:ATP-binding cassette domain-containing protein [Paraburkholderia xenovorans]|uniref:ABC transporter ATP-binding protein n=1 Tax=Paraburkholderia xenovorans TaxID=36873 RepID=UPI0038BC3169
MAWLEIRDLRKSYAGKPASSVLRRVFAARRGAPPSPPPARAALDGVSLDIERGEAVGLVGESGCGKSTLSAVLARLIDADSGRILFDGQAILDLPASHAARAPWRSRIQMVFQDPLDSLDPHARVFDAIADPLRQLCAGRYRTQAALRAQVERVAAQVGLPLSLLERRPHQLSGGQAARVGIARALVLEPDLLILDEPTSALDVSMQAVVLRLFDRLRRETGVSLLFVSHDLGVVRLLCQRAYVMRAGRIEEHGAIDALFDAPRSAYTRALLDAVPRFPDTDASASASAKENGNLRIPAIQSID